MNTISLFTIYTTIAAAVAIHAFYYGVLSRPRVIVFSLADQGILAITSAAVGAIWLLFVPALLVLAAARISQVIRTRSGGWSLPRAHHARAGS